MDLEVAEGQTAISSTPVVLYMIIMRLESPDARSVPYPKIYALRRIHTLRGGKRTQCAWIRAGDILRPCLCFHTPAVSKLVSSVTRF